MSTHSPESLVLCKSKKQQRPFILTLLVFPILLLFALYIGLVDDWPALWQKIQADLLLFVLITLLILMIPLLPVLMLFYQYQLLKREKLILDADGIRYQSHLPTFLQGLLPMISYRDWSAKWSEITAIYLKPYRIARGPFLLILGFHLGLRYHELFPCQWVNPDADDGPLIKLPREEQWYSPTPEQVKTALQRCPVIKFLTKRGIELEIDPKVSLKTPFYQFDSNQEMTQKTLKILGLLALLLGAGVLYWMFYF